MNIVCLPGAVYDFHPWNNRQQVMSRLAKMGHRVLYLDPAKNIFIQLLKIIFKIKPGQKTFLWFKRPFKSALRENGPDIFSLIQFLPTKWRFLRKLNYFLNLARIKNKINQLKMTDCVLWIYTPDAAPLAGKLQEKLVVYDCVDNYASQPGYQKNFKGIVDDEIQLLKISDLVFTSCSGFYKEKIRFNKNVHLIQNVGDYDHFIKAALPETAIPKDIAGISHPIIGFIGSLDDYKVDFELLIYLAREKPEWSIVLIGGLVWMPGDKKGLKALKNKKNIYVLGPRLYETLPAYLKSFDVCIIPYKSNEYTKTCFPIKFFEYLASGKPVVVSGLPQLEQFSNLIKISKNKEEFVAAISESLKAEDPAKKQKRINLAQENSWENKVKKQLEIIDSFLRKS